PTNPEAPPGALRRCSSDLQDQAESAGPASERSEPATMVQRCAIRVIDKSYAVALLQGGLEGLRPSKKPFPPRVGGYAADTGRKEMILGGGQAAPRPPLDTPCWYKTLVVYV